MEVWTIYFRNILTYISFNKILFGTFRNVDYVTEKYDTFPVFLSDVDLLVQPCRKFKLKGSRAPFLYGPNSNVCELGM